MSTTNALTRRDPRRPDVLFATSLATYLAAMAAMVYTLTAPTQWAGSAEWGLAAALGATGLLCLSARRRGSVRWRLRLTSALLLVMTTYFGLRLVGIDLIAEGGWLGSQRQLLAERPLHIALLTGISGLAAIAITMRSMWARWLALALAGAGVVSSGLNAIGTFQHRDAGVWLLLVMTAGAAMALMNLSSGAGMREAIEERLAPDSVWRSRERVILLLRASVLTNFIVIPMLLVYAWVQPIVPATASSALGLAGLLAVATALTVMRKTFGAVLLSVSGIALLGLTAGTLYLAHLDGPNTLWISLYYAVFWIPGALFASLAGIALTRPVLAVLRR